MLSSGQVNFFLLISPGKSDTFSSETVVMHPGLKEWQRGGLKPTRQLRMHWAVTEPWEVEGLWVVGSQWVVHTEWCWELLRKR